MENAAKALLIAGAILICIVLISVGMAILSAAQDVTDGVGDTTTSQAVQAFNSPFMAYSGTQKGSAVKSLLQAVSASNANNGSNKTIEIEHESTKTTDPSTIVLEASKITPSGRYTVEVKSVDKEGYIDAIKITKKMQ